MTAKNLVILGAALLLPAKSSAKTIPYPGEFATLAAAVQAASPGDTVLVAPGNYQEKVRMKTGVVLRSSAGRDSTVLTSPDTGLQPMEERLVECTDVDSTTAIEGFTLEHGKSLGAAFYCENSKPVIRNNVIRGFGWGINLRYSPAYLADNIVENCTAFAILIVGCSPTLHRNEIRNNGSVALDITGNHSMPVIGGSAENANKFYGNVGAVRISGRKDVVANWNDWGWETTEEMNKKGYPADIIGFIDGNDFGKSHRGRGKLDYRNWITASSVKPASAPSPAQSAGSDSTPATKSKDTRRYLPFWLAGAVVVIFAARAARRRRASERR